MRMNPDGTVEGTPEELAAFKHIDAALATKNHKPRKERGPKEKKEETVEISEVLSDALNCIKERGGETTVNQVAETLGIKPATALYRLNRLASLGVVTKPKRGIFAA